MTDSIVSSRDFSPSKGDVVLVYLHEKYKQYMVLTLESRHHVVRNDCLEAIGLGGEGHKPLITLAVMGASELCQTRKVWILCFK